MSLNKINLRNWVLVFIIIAAAATRFIFLGQQTVLSNFTPIGAIALFGGTYFTDKYKAYLVPILTLLVSDVFVTYTYTGQWTLFYSGFFWVYASFAFMVFIGSRIKKVNAGSVLLGALASVLVHWIITDIQPWLAGTMYNKDITGYYQSLIAAIPFERNLLLGNLVYGAILYGGFELAQARFTVLKRVG
ncbi:MAG: hypothetical protein EAZ51_00380 [Sphingobacteriales bacterium]|nr:MAG: hypothetical protein EAZ64_06040 [Sphingobacteriales bacterium]TAF83858.1 MAG: hypothetical protein EAZ51_00380 [Sphingobacteriales bacterium]